MGRLPLHNRRSSVERRGERSLTVRVHTRYAWLCAHQCVSVCKRCAKRQFRMSSISIPSNARLTQVANHKKI